MTASVLTGRSVPRCLLALALLWLAAGLASCSSVPRFTRPDVHAPRASAPDRPAGPHPVESWEAGMRWKTTVSWYGEEFHGQPTASGEAYQADRISAAHRDLPFGTWLQVTNLDNGKKLEVRVNDRGPFKEGRDLDLSREAARRLGFLDTGTARVEVRILTLP